MRKSKLWFGCATTLVGLCLLLAAPAARASCMAPTPKAPLTVLPADGATGVPTDAHVWVLAGFGVGAAVTAEGGVGVEPISHQGPWAEFALTGVKPGDTVTWSVSLSSNEEPPIPFGPFTFQVGDGAAEAVTVPVLDHVEVVPGASLQGPCDGLLAIQECFDTGQDTLVRVHVAPQPGAALYRACQESAGTTGCGVGFAVPSTCPPAVYTWAMSANPDPPVCFRIEAVNVAGAVSETLVACTDGSTDTLEPGDATEGGGGGGGSGGADTGGTSGDSAGCTATTSAPGAPILGLLLLVALALRSGARSGRRA